MKKRLSEIARVIRSKNAGPYELTFDIIFNDRETYEQVAARKIINPGLIAGLYKIPVGYVLSVTEFAPALAIKATIIRPLASGDTGDTDVYGAQQHAPLLDVEI